MLVARAKSLLRRLDVDQIEVGPIIINAEKVEAQIDSKKVELTVTEFNILYTLASQLGKVFSRDQIMDKAYQSTMAADIYDRTVDAHIKNIRKKLKAADAERDYILTVIGKGYKFNEELTTLR